MMFYANFTSVEIPHEQDSWILNDSVAYEDVLFDSDVLHGIAIIIVNHLEDSRFVQTPTYFENKKSD
jgi:hypothetical protein